MSCLSAQAVLLAAGMDHISAELIREEIEIRAEIDCSEMKTNVLCASDGVLYSSEPEPLFVTE